MEEGQGRRETEETGDTGDKGGREEGTKKDGNEKGGYRIPAPTLVI
jgi:hypothetical protein